MDRLVEKCGFVLLFFSILLLPTESNASSNCTERHLTFCQEQFNENKVPVCPEVVKLKSCLAVCENSKSLSTWDEWLKYKSLLKKMNSYPDCVPVSKVHKKECNEEFVNNCFQQYNHNATPICPEVKKLRICISELTGCHAMKHPKFVLSRDILEKHRECFFVNYSRILEVLKKKDPDSEEDESSQEAKTKQTGATMSVMTINTTEKPSESKPEQETGHLPYTFVVVATVCTCMFLVVLVVFSIVRHTTLSKRQRNSSIERAPMRIRIRSHDPRYRTRHHRRHRSSRGHVAMHGPVRQTVSGFFEGNVAPPPYSAVLDDTESVRAGDAPPPYQPTSCGAIGVIV